MIQIREYEKGDIYKVLLHANEKYQMQYMREDVLMQNISFTGIDEQGNIVGCAGLAELWDGVYEAWIALDERYKNHISIFRFLRKCLDDLNGSEATRVHAHMNVNTQNYSKLMHFLGFEEEAILKNYFPNKTDCVLYRRLYECHS